MKKNFQSGSATVWVIGALVILVVATIYALFNKVPTHPKAVSSTGVGTISLSPATVTHYPGDTFTTTVKFKTGTTSSNVVTISGVAFRITYPYSGTTPQLDVVDSAGNPATTVTPDPTLTANGWSFPVKSVTRANGLVTIDVSAVYQNGTNPALGFSTTTDTNLATLIFKANAAAASNPITLAFDSTKSVMLTKADPPVDVLASPVSGQYTVQNDTVAPVAVSDLAMTSNTTTSVSLNWTSPTDVGPAGKASTYDLRYSTSAITAANFATATQVAGVPTPSAPGVKDSTTVSGLSPNTPYFFAIESKDAAGNTSAISNVLSASTQNPNSTFTFGYKLQDVPSAAKTDTGTLTFFPAGTSSTAYVYSNVATTQDANGVFRPNTPVSLNATSLPINSSGVSYDVYFTSQYHLRKKMGTMTINFGANAAPSAWDTTVMKVGDFNSDNKIDGTDIAALINQYTALSVTVTSANKPYDVDESGNIDLFDVSDVLANYTALIVNGD